MLPPAPKVVLITGCTAGGIGFHLCEQFAERGCIVYATSRRLESMEGFKHEKIHTMVMDVTKDDDVQTVVQKVLADQGKIDIVVNNAGALAIGPIGEVTMEQVRNAFELNTFAAVRVSNAVIPSMVKYQEGLIINIGSIAGIVTTPWNTVYCAAKAALHSITEGLSMELKPFGINVMLVVPGGVKSNISKNHASMFKLPPNSMYKDYEERMIERMNLAANKDSMPTDEFAKQVVEKALCGAPPPYMSLGWNARKVAWYQWLPRQYVLGLMYKAMCENNT
ncbi:hypothetical protein SCLCIDRAFT_15171 [Scleroderma citrinum Foug A]|uniref:Ketoreductase domain-containing protein n=1 Tax=Scleroderma citrinum Foug A TaxID=1036808 RepID=A0A0C3AI05_9AGAM|nr:hypothetical protein SCLCIDRAFT_15171 [Scleroderma citrinum Foug A]